MLAIHVIPGPMAPDSSFQSQSLHKGHFQINVLPMHSPRSFLITTDCSTMAFPHLHFMIVMASYVRVARGEEIGRSKSLPPLLDPRDVPAWILIERRHSLIQLRCTNSLHPF